MIPQVMSLMRPLLISESVSSKEGEPKHCLPHPAVIQRSTGSCIYGSIDIPVELGRLLALPHPTTNDI